MRERMSVKENSTEVRLFPSRWTCNGKRGSWCGQKQEAGREKRFMTAEGEHRRKGQQDGWVERQVTG